MIRRATGVAIAVAVLLAACGDDDSSGADTTGVPTTATPTTAAPTTGAPTTAAPTTAAPTTAAPTTAAPTSAAPTTAAAEPGAPDGDDEAAATAWALVFDSTVPFDQKAPHLADADVLAVTIDAYAATGEGFGGITLVPTAVVVDGDTAAITYDVEFGGNPAYSDQQGTLIRVDGVWVVGRDEFCSFMASARVGCEG